jgi:phage shock protein PspC (stress-responsive transcriptional regulator)
VLKNASQLECENYISCSKLKKNLTKKRMTRNATDKWLGGVLGGIARALGISSGLLRGLFLVFFFGVGGLTFGISSGSTIVIYLIFWFTLGKS